MTHRSPVIFVTREVCEGTPARAFWPWVAAALDRAAPPVRISITDPAAIDGSVRARLGASARLESRRPQPWNPVWRARHRLHGADLAHRTLDRNDFVIVWQDSPFEGHRTADYCRSRGIPYVLVCGTAWERDWPPDSRRESLQRSFAEAAAIWVPGEATQASLSRFLAADLPHCHILPPWHDAAPADLSWPSETDGWNLVHAGPTPPVPGGLDLIFDVLDTDRWRDRPVRCTFHAPGPWRPWLEASAARSGPDRFRLATTTDAAAPAACWRDAHGGLYPTRRGEIAAGLRDALSAGRPVIAAGTGDIPAVIDDGANGFLSAAAHRACLAETLERAWDLRASWRTMGIAAASAIRGLPGPAEAAGRWVEHLLPLLRGSLGRAA